MKISSTQQLSEASSLTPQGPPVNRRWHLVFVLLFFLAIVLRYIFLTMKPPHFDEGINGFFVQQMWKQGFYKYDPHNFHGPLYFYILQFTELIFGKGIWGMRAITCAMGLAGVWLIYRHREFFGRAALFAAVLVAFSPAMVFYNRYAIHESLFIFFQILFSFGFLRWRQQPTRRAYLYMLLGVLGSFATKETFFIFFGTWVISLFCVRISERYWPSLPVAVGQVKKNQKARAQTLPRELKIVMATDTLVFVLLTLALFSGFLMNRDGVRDMIMAYSFWTKTGTAHVSGHEKYFWYWWDLLRRYEWFGLLSVILGAGFFLRAQKWLRHFFFLSFGLFLAYSIIPYKTPWLIMGMLWPMALLLGMVIEQALRHPKPLVKWSVAAIGVIVFIQAFAQTIRMNFYHYIDSEEPYVYVQSTGDINEVMALIETHIKQFPEDYGMYILDMNRDPWPFPWLLGGYGHVEFTNAESMDIDKADVIFLDAGNAEAVEKKLKKPFWKRSLDIRNSYDHGFAYFSMEKFINLKPATALGIAPVSPQ